MKTTKKKNPNPQRKPRILKKSGISKRARNAERVRLEGLVSDLSKTRDNLGEKVRQQTDEIKEGVDKQQRSEEQIYIRTKAMESTADGIFIIDAQKPNFPVIYANQSFQAMTGYGKKEIVGRNYFLLYGADADPRIVEEIKHTIHQGKSFHREMLSFRKDGNKYWNLLRCQRKVKMSGFLQS